MNAQNNLSKDFTIVTTPEDLPRIIALGDALRQAGYSVENVERELTVETINRANSRYILQLEKNDIKIVNNLKNSFDRTPYDLFIEKIPYLGEQESRH